VGSSNALRQATGFYRSALGKKAIMAVTGAIGFAFVVGHLLGNLQFYLGPETLNEYAASLRRSPGLLLAARLTLLGAVVAHIAASFQLTAMNAAARPHGYRVWTPRTSTFASRTMKFSGPVLGLFIAYHLLHLTAGVVHPNFKHGPGQVPDAYHNLVAGFSSIPASLCYIAAMVFLGFHMSHGVWSMFQSVGWNHPRYTPVVRTVAVAAAILIVLGNISIPISVLLGFHDEL
jgi:succinate dehydrogenase / fumarate reductase, cytochrome b subunit